MPEAGHIGREVWELAIEVGVEPQEYLGGDPLLDDDREVPGRARPLALRCTTYEVAPLPAGIEAVRAAQQFLCEPKDFSLVDAKWLESRQFRVWVVGLAPLVPLVVVKGPELEPPRSISGRYLGSSIVTAVATTRC